MKRRHIAYGTGIAIAVMLTTLSSAAEGISPEIRKKAEAATALVMVSAQEHRGSGTAFLVKRDSTNGYFVTCHHVVESPLPESTRISLYLYCGTDEEREIDATVIATDPEHDLAVLKTSDRMLPEPLTLYRPTDKLMAMDAYAFGFPVTLETGMRPNDLVLTMSPAEVMHYRGLESYGEALRISIRAGVHPGNSGGPMVNAEGEVIGVVAAKFMHTKVAMMTGWSAVDNCLRGQIAMPELNETVNKDSFIKFEVTAQSADPFQQITNAALLLKHADLFEHTIAPARTGHFVPMVLDPDIFPLEKGDDGTYLASLELTGPTSKNAIYGAQVRWMLRDGSILYGRPFAFNADFAAGITPEHRETVWAKTQSPELVLKKFKKAGYRLVKSSSRSAKRTSQAIDDLTVWELHFGDLKVVDVIPGRKSGTAYVHLSNGSLHLLSLPDCTVTRTLMSEGAIKHLGLTSNGLVFVDTRHNTVWLLDEHTLDPLHFKQIPMTELLATSKDSPSCLALGEFRDRLYLVDPSANADFSELMMEKAHRATQMHISDSGKRVIMAEDLEVIEYRIKIGKLVRQKLPGGKIPAGRITVSPDLEYLAVSGRFKGKVPEGHPIIPTDFGAYIYELDNLGAPVCVSTLPGSGYIFGFDPGLAEYYLQGGSTLISIADGNGMIQKKYDRPADCRGVRNAFWMPNADGFLLHTVRSKILWAERKPSGKERQRRSGWVASAEVSRLMWAYRTGKSIERNNSCMESSDTMTNGVFRLVLDVSDAEELVPSAVWHFRSASVVLADTAGSLHRLSMPAGICREELWLGKGIADMQDSAEGIVVLTHAPEEIVVVSKGRLNVINRFAATNARFIAASPGSSDIFILESYNKRPPQRMNLQTGEMTDAFTPKQLDVIGTEYFPQMKVTPDGKYFLVVGKGLHRLRIEDNGLVHEQVRDDRRIGTIAISGDSGYLIAGKARGSFVETPVCAISDITKPVAYVPAKGLSVFDSIAKRLYGLADRKLVSSSISGDVTAEYPLTKSFYPRSISVHPEGERVMVFGRANRVVCLDLGPDRNWIRKKRGKK